MLIELNSLPIEVQQKISRIEQGENVAFSKNGKVFATIQPTNSQPIKRSAYEVIMSYDFPEVVADIELELPKRQMPSQKSMALFD